MARPHQPELGFPAGPQRGASGLRGLDLFAGIGGLSAGFARAGFAMIGADREAVATEVYTRSGFGEGRTLQLDSEACTIDVPVVIGGPPCRPWSAVNVQRRGRAHEDHKLLNVFVEHVRQIRPEVFVMENVPALGSDELYRSGIDSLRSLDGSRYHVERKIIHYERFGASTRRRRLFTVGVKNSATGASRLFEMMDEYQSPARTVADAILWLRDQGRGAVPDHDWSELRSIHKYGEHYASGKFGWVRLRYDEPAPSFGSVAKTYILHPEAGVGTYPERVVSVREVLSIMGFGPEEAVFPAGTSRGKRYQMAANSVSPMVSGAVAQAVRRLLTGEAAAGIGMMDVVPMQNKAPLPTSHHGDQALGAEVGR
ncbi:MAG: DNA cytosine methyltransferase [Gemmatimonadaceae bacterium]